MQPKIRYARNGDVNIAYAVAGSGPDLVFIPGFVSNLDFAWESSLTRPFFERLASFSRLIMFDKRGTGLSDRHSVDTTIDVRMDDAAAVMDAAGSERATIFGVSEGGPMAIFLAATHPDRVSSLVILSSAPRWSEADDYPMGAPLGQLLEGSRAAVPALWGKGAVMASMAPSIPKTPETMEEFGRFERGSATPGAVLAHMNWVASIDVRPALPTLTVPTLVIHRRDDGIVPFACGRYMADHIPDARFVELAGDVHIPMMGDTLPLLDEIEEFVTGVRGHATADRVLATVLFTDIVDSTRLASEMGDHRWRDLLGRHDARAQAEVGKHRGRVVKHIGDGILATFDGPARGVHAARALVDAARELGIEIRAGLHTGEVEVVGDDVGGIAVHIGARVASKAEAGETLVSSTVKDLVVGSMLRFEDRGTHMLKGIPDEWRLFALTN